MATRIDFAGEKLMKSLLVLQDKLPPFSVKQVHHIIEKELSTTLMEIFSDFDDNAISAASVAQVHKARLKSNNQVVAVKILRPNIANKININLQELKSLIVIAEYFLPKKMRKYQLKNTLNLLTKNLYRELDLRFEAANFAQLRDNSLQDNSVFIPQVFWQYVKKNVLIMEWIEGESILNFNNHPKSKNLIKNLIFTFFNQAYRDGMFHGDLHAGNILVDKNYELCLIDFGSIGFLDQEIRIYLAEILRGFINRDYWKVAEVQFAANFVPATQNKASFMLACRTIGETCIHNSTHVSIAEILQQFLSVLKLFDMQIQPQLLLFQKNLIMLEGICQQLDNNSSIWNVSRPWVEQWAKNNFTIRKVFLRKLHKTFKITHSVHEIIKNVHLAQLKNKNNTPENNNNSLYMIIIILLLLAIFSALIMLIIQ